MRRTMGGLLAPPAVIFVCLYLHQDPATGLNAAGGLLQLGGLILVVRGLSAHRRDFGDGLGLLEAAYHSSRQWIRVKLGATHRVSKSITVHAESGVFVSDAAEADLTYSGKSLEERVEALERDLKEARQQLRDAERETRRRWQELTSAISNDRGHHKNDIARVEAQVKRLATGGIHLDLIGVWWVGFGIFLQTWTEPLARLWS